MSTIFLYILRSELIQIASGENPRKNAPYSCSAQQLARLRLYVYAKLGDLFLLAPLSVCDIIIPDCLNSGQSTCEITPVRILSAPSKRSELLINQQSESHRVGISLPSELDVRVPPYPDLHSLLDLNC